MWICQIRIDTGALFVVPSTCLLLQCLQFQLRMNLQDAKKSGIFRRFDRDTKQIEQIKRNEKAIEANANPCPKRMVNQMWNEYSRFTSWIACFKFIRRVCYVWGYIYGVRIRILLSWLVRRRTRCRILPDFCCKYQCTTEPCGWLFAV